VISLQTTCSYQYKWYVASVVTHLKHKYTRIYIIHVFKNSIHTSEEKQCVYFIKNQPVNAVKENN